MSSIEEIRREGLQARRRYLEMQIEEHREEIAEIDAELSEVGR